MPPAKKTFTILLGTAPYASENTLTAVRIASSALAKGHAVNIFVSADGVYCFLKGQKARGVPNAEELFGDLVKQGLRVYL